MELAEPRSVGNMRAIDGDSHFIEPLDLFERYTDAAYRDRTVCVDIDSDGRVTGLNVDRRPMRMADLDELMSDFARNIWVSANPEERMFPLMVRFAGDQRFFIGFDYPHAEGFLHPIRTTRELLAALPERSIERILCDNAATFYGI
jgi:hypothetical protein